MIKMLTLSPLQVIIQIITAALALLFFFLGTNMLYYGLKRKFSPSLALAPAMYAFTSMLVLDFTVRILSQADIALARLLMTLSNVSIIILALSFIIYTDRIIGSAVSPRTVVGIFITALTLGVAWGEPWWIEYSSEYGWIQHLNADFILVFFLMVLFGLINFLLTLWSAYREVEGLRRRLIIGSVFWGFIIAGIGGGLFVIVGELGVATGIEIVPGLDNYILLFGMAIVGIAQIVDPLALYFIRAKIDVCGIASDSGIPYVSYVPEGGLFDVTLGTAAIAGVQALIKEVAQAEKRIKSLDSGDKKILFEYSQPGEESMVAAFLISSIETIALRDALSHILNSFVSQFKNDLDQIVDSDRFESFKADIENILSFAISKTEEKELEADDKPQSFFSRLLRPKK
ncbi:MAG: hypothetical protein ACFFC7_02565 [Candidatus Hermodarchaeota archaeon]